MECPRRSNPAFRLEADGSGIPHPRARGANTVAFAPPPTGAAQETPGTDWTSLTHLASIFEGVAGVKCANGAILQALTVDADDFDHGEGEEGQRRHVHLDEDGRHQEDHQDDHQAAKDPQLLWNPEW